jgi:hypothetical protein
MKNQIFINTNSYLRSLLLVSAVCLLGFTGCSSVDARVAKDQRAAPNRYVCEQQ